MDTNKPGDTVTYVMNENFRDPNKPFFKSVTFKGGGDAPGAARAAFQTGEADYAWNLQVDAAVLKPMATASTLANLVTVYGSSVERILVNFANPAASLGDKRGEPDTQHPYFSDKAVRRALAMASDRATVATQFYGKPITRDHGGPARVIIPKLYGWKGAKFVRAIEFVAEDQPGFWEVRGYSNTADPWTEDRFS